jgi:dethiobiotin synthetase
VRRIVILGTGTGVGKTYFTTAIARALSSVKGVSAFALKPVETGFTPMRSGGPPVGSDAARLEAATPNARRLRPHPLFLFREPISPHLAARRERRAVSLTRVAAWAKSAEALHDSTRHRITIHETAGGVFSPLSATATNFDLAMRLEPAVWILVAPDALGVLHDVRATLLAMQHRGRAPDHLVLTASRAPDASTGSNSGELRRVGLPKSVATLARDDEGGHSLRALVRVLVGPP